MSTSPKVLIQTVAYIKRNPKLTREEFYEYWTGHHGSLAVPWMKEKGVLRYQQIHATGSILPNREGCDTSKALEFDGVTLTLIAAEDAEGFMKSVTQRSDEYYQTILVPDEGILLDGEAPGRGIIAIFAGQSIEMIGERSV